MQHRIVVLGAGYTGAIAAGRLARRLYREDVAITLVNAEPDFVERVRLHQLAAGQELSPRPLSEMFAGTGVKLRLAKVTGVDVDRRTVAVVDADGPGDPETEELEYDTLVYALGSGWNDQGVPGAAEHAHQIAGRPGALRLRERLARLDAGESVVVVGGGLTGLEAATEIAEARPDLDVALAARGELGDWLSPKGRRHLRKVFGKLGITVHEHAAVTGVEADRVTTADGGTIPAAVTLWTTGFAVHPIAKATTLDVTDTGQIVVDGTMRSVSHPDVYAIGDAALAMGPGDKPLRMSCASGTPMAWQAADAIAARLTGGKLPNAPLRYFNQCISLGRREGLIQYVTADDRAVRAALTGRFAAVYKELVCKGAAWGVSNPTLGLPTRRRHVVRQPARAGSPVRTAA
ncbi:NAD(P)/FAD-dependent oxidoreductase [Streptomyces sp. DH10]|uniref:NAD(P)/FAD-dependent oxidoreductase n=1 Tax=Streptomyces sp. DH10 TaxID=3040121 RepID=UPI002443396F|nr:FAD-dependent oxidoreductase [Streptomyces sp. DH10]MDG9707005.1 FAD-dependent oxidoreductase [Streptomyces sp. DH10]